MELRKKMLRYVVLHRWGAGGFEHTGNAEEGEGRSSAMASGRKDAIACKEDGSAGGFAPPCPS